ncbi:MAG: HAMP domain-containing protein [Myxococcales bacterium]|nr:HAMP domain-containing protein [Myxococcales bacterium]
MRRLFAQIFLWFAGALTLLLVVSYAVNNVWRTASPIKLVDRGPSSLYAALAVEAYERGGRGELDTALSRIEKLTGAKAYLVDRGGRELSGRTLPARVAEVARSVLREGAGERRFVGQKRFFARPTRGKGGARYVYVNVAPPQRGLLRVVLPEHAEKVLLVLAILLGALVCYLLARHLSAPISTLRRATQRLAEGDLSARVDTSARRRVAEIAELAHDFDRMAERVESLVGAQRELLQNVSHELRSPLARLRVALELARQRGGAGDEAKAAEALDRIERETERLDQLIGLLLTLSRLESRTETLARERVDIGALLREVVADARYELRGTRSIAIEVEHAKGADAEALVVRGAPSLLRSALENVVRNALRYTDDGTEVSVRVEDRGALHVCVRDHGPGVPEDELESIFAPFVRVSAARERDSGGAGLGLAVTRRAIEAHGGEVSARNARGGGLAVEIVLPRGALT